MRGRRRALGAALCLALATPCAGGWWSGDDSEPAPEPEAALAAATEQLADVAGVTLEGHPSPQYNSLYLPAGEHEGWPRFESAEGKHLYRHIEGEKWFVAAKFEPDTRKRAASALTPHGRLPVGTSDWHIAKVQYQPLTVALLGAAELAEYRAEQARAEADREAGEKAEEVAAALAATEQLTGVLGVGVEGHPARDSNGVYLPVGDYKGWPRFENGAGRKLYRLKKGSKWVLAKEFGVRRPSTIKAIKGPLPAGTNDWSVWSDELQKYQKRPLTVTLLNSQAKVDAAQVRFLTEIVDDFRRFVDEIWRILDGISGSPSRSTRTATVPPRR